MVPGRSHGYLHAGRLVELHSDTECTELVVANSNEEPDYCAGKDWLDKGWNWITSNFWNAGAWLLTGGDTVIDSDDANRNCYTVGAHDKGAYVTKAKGCAAPGLAAVDGTLTPAESRPSPPAPDAPPAPEDLQSGGHYSHINDYTYAYSTSPYGAPNPAPSSGISYDNSVSRYDRCDSSWFFWDTNLRGADLYSVSVAVDSCTECCNLCGDNDDCRVW